jgi:hypothetical protein
MSRFSFPLFYNACARKKATVPENDAEADAEIDRPPPAVALFRAPVARRADSDDDYENL